MSDGATTDGERATASEDLFDETSALRHSPEPEGFGALASPLSEPERFEAEPNALTGASKPEYALAFEFANGAPQPSAFRTMPVIRTPNLVDALLFLLMLLLGFVVSTGLAGLALHFHWFGLRDFAQMQNDTRLALGTQALLYGVAVIGAVPFFRMVWGRGLLAGLHWHAATAWRLRWRLVVTAFVCNVIAMLGNWVLPFPQHAPIDKMFGTSADAWLLMGFGITVAPFVEEMIFRGFLLPGIATAWDWCSERMTGHRPRPLDGEGNPVWSVGAMIFAALVVSAPFALMHAEQVGKAWGPLLLLYCVSLILCTVRLATRSLAASTLVHSAYNFMLFAVMFAQTDGFRHMDKM
jgi:membrane protease YdiL (CAAX protease family)